MFPDNVTNSNCYCQILCAIQFATVESAQTNPKKCFEIEYLVIDILTRDFLGL